MMNVCSMGLRLAAALSLLLSLGLWAGCQSKAPQKALHPVRGQVLYQGVPIKDCRVIFYPMDDPNDIERPEAYTDEGGYFEVMGRRDRPGAAVGRYQVAFLWMDRHPEPDGSSDFIGPNKLPAKYGRAETSTVIVEIKEGKNELEPFRLQPQ